MHSHLSRREFIKSGTIVLLAFKTDQQPSIQTVNGSISAGQMGKSLIHEHFIVDFIGADQINFDRWKKDEVVAKVLPYLLEVKKYGVKTILDCTPAFLGRDVILLKRLAEESGLNILTNTGYYGAVKNKYLPAWAFTETAEQLSRRWIEEFKIGIEGTGIKPGFIKISVDPEHLSELHRKMVKAAALTHLETGLTICSHTGIAIPAFEEIEVLKEMGVHPSAFVWVHAQSEKDKARQVEAARLGAWISLDGIAWGDAAKYADSIEHLRSASLLNKVLISHDAGWYKPGEVDGGSFKGFTTIFQTLIPLLKERGFTESDIEQLLVKNPAEAFGIRVRAL